MTVLSKQIQGYLQNSSWIRRMFEAGISLKQQYGADNVYDFSLGNPDLPPPALIVTALRQLADKAHEPFSMGYMPNSGHVWARTMLAEFLSAEQNITVPMDNVILTCGAAGAINALFRSIIEQGDEVIAIAPYFVEYGFYIENHGGRLCPVKSKPDSFAIDLSAIEAAITPKTRAIIVNTPNNPTGVIYSADELKALVSLLEKYSHKFGRPILLISDEPYRFLAFDDSEVAPILPLYSYAVVVGSFSKNLSLAGERLGYLALSPFLSAEERNPFIAALTMTNRILGFVNPPVVGQHLMAAALNSPVDAKIYEKRRDIMAQVLLEAGYEFQLPKGAFYFFPKAPGGDDIAFVQTLLEQRILGVPGSGFAGPGHFRLAFCVNEDVITKAAPGFKKAREAYK